MIEQFQHNRDDQELDIDQASENEDGTGATPDEP